MPVEFETHSYYQTPQWAQKQKDGRGDTHSQAICAVFAVSFGTRPVHWAKMQSSARPSASLRFRATPPRVRPPRNYKLHSIKKSCRGAQININSMNINCQDELLERGVRKNTGGGQWQGGANGSIDLHIGRHDDDGDNAHGPKCTQAGPKRKRGLAKWQDFVLNGQAVYSGLKMC